MKYFSSTLFVAMALLLFASCSITSSVHFNRNFSGDYQMSIDMSDMMGMASMFDSSGVSEEDMMAELGGAMEEMGLEKSLEGTKGISDVTSEISKDGKIMISLKFDDVQALDNAFYALQSDVMSGEGGMGLMGQGGGAGEMNKAPSDQDRAPLFIKKGKTITHRSLDSGDENIMDMMGEDEDGMFDMVSSMMDYTIEFTFDRKLKSVEVSGMDILKEEKHLVRTRVDVAKMVQEGAYQITLSLK